MSDFKFKLNKQGVKEFLKSKQVEDMLSDVASNIASRAGNGYKSNVQIGKNRATARVLPDTFKAKKDNKKNNTLLKAVRG